MTKKHVPKKRTPEVLPELTETELDLLSHIERGYQLETDSIGGEPVRRSLRDGELIPRPLPTAGRCKRSKARADSGYWYVSNVRR